MSDTMPKSLRLLHTIMICNIKSLPCTKLEKIEFDQKLPGHAQILKGPIILRTGFFPDLKFSGMVPAIIFYHF